MSDNANRWTSGAFARRLVLLPVLVAAVGLAFAGTASAQTPFQATVKGTGNPHQLCPGGATYVCGTADIAGYGTGSWAWLATSINFVRSSCDSTYTATDVFTLASDGSTLVLNESGYGCGPGKDANGFFMGGPNKQGSPNTLYGTWTVDTADSTGQFAGLGGSGTDVLQSAGGRNFGSYTGTLGA